MNPESARNTNKNLEESRRSLAPKDYGSDRLSEIRLARINPADKQRSLTLGSKFQKVLFRLLVADNQTASRKYTDISDIILPSPSPPKFKGNFLFFGNGEAYLIKEEYKVLIQDFFDKFDKFIVIRHTLNTLEDFDLSYDFARNAARYLNLEIERNSSKHSQKIAVEQFWLKSFITFLQQLKQLSCEVEGILKKCKKSNIDLGDNVQETDRIPHQYKEREWIDELIIDVGNYLYSFEQTGVVEQPEILFFDNTRSYKDYFIQFRNGKRQGHTGLATNETEVGNMFSKDELYLFDTTLKKFHRYYTFSTLVKKELPSLNTCADTSEMSLDYENTNLDRLKAITKFMLESTENKIPNNMHRYSQHFCFDYNSIKSKANKYFTSSNYSNTITNDATNILAEQEKNVFITNQFLNEVLTETNNFRAELISAKLTYAKFNIEICGPSESAGKIPDYPMLDEKILNEIEQTIKQFVL